MKNKEERLEKKILRTITKLRSSPLQEKELYSLKLEKHFRDYKRLTGDDYRIQ